MGRPILGDWDGGSYRRGTICGTHMRHWELGQLLDEVSVRPYYLDKLETVSRDRYVEVGIPRATQLAYKKRQTGLVRSLRRH